MTPEGRFLSDVVRSLAEKMRALDYECQAALRHWAAGMNDNIPNDSTVIDDGRVEQGIPGVAGSDVHALIAHVQEFVAQMDAGNAREVVQRVCVRALRVLDAEA